jgi:protein SHQ1
MLTPRFKLSQDDNHVYIVVHAPYTNIGDTEIDIDGENFLFVSSPYFLRLRLPGKIVDNDSSKGSYTCDSGDFSLTFDKETPGEYFENLDMITSLLAPRDIPDINPSLVEMLEEDGITLEDNEGDNSNKFTYGFANKITTEFNEIGSIFPQIFELKAPEKVAIEERNALRIKYEKDKFSSDHYLADYFDRELLFPYLSYVPYLEVCGYRSDNVHFTQEEIGVLKDLPNKHYLLNNIEKKQILLGMIDILYSYCYDKRSTLDESTVESGWTINKLSSTLSWFCVFNNMKEVLVACYRRTLVYPIYRNYLLCDRVKSDLTFIVKLGKRLIIKRFIEIYQMFNSGTDARHILNQLYIKDYLVFLQLCRDEEIVELYDSLNNTEIKKGDLDLELEELESAGRLVQQEENNVMENEMALRMAHMSLLGLGKKGDGYEESSNSSYDSSSSTDSSSDSSSDESSDDLDSDDDPL